MRLVALGGELVDVVAYAQQVRGGSLLALLLGLGA